MNRITLTLVKDVFKKDYRWLPHDFKKDEMVYMISRNTHEWLGENGIVCTTEESKYFFELPATTLALRYYDKDYGIFMTEQGMGYELLYLKELPFDCLELLTKTQSNTRLVQGNAEYPVYKSESKILKLLINANAISIKEGQLEDVEPLF